MTVNHFWTLKEPQVAAERSIPKPCTPELMGLLHLNQSTNQLLHCNGVSWKPWTPTDQVGIFLNPPPSHISAYADDADDNRRHLTTFSLNLLLKSQMVSAQTCPRGWTFHDGRCYVLIAENKVTWSEANRSCRERYRGGKHTSGVGR